MELAKLLMADCKTTGDVQAKLKKLFAGTIEQMLEAEMDEHLGYEKNSVEGNNSGNSRNGYGKKTISSEYGECEIAVPRDRNGEFEPKVIEKRQTRTDEVEKKIMAMYAKGMSQRDIEDMLKEIYGAEMSLSDPIDCDLEGNALTIEDIFASSINVEQLAELKINSEKLYRYIEEELDDREREIICKPMTQREIAKEMGISRSYISRIEKRALTKLNKRFSEGSG